MSDNSLGPHQPKEGWALRWLVQGAALLVRMPDVLVMTSLAALAIGCLRAFDVKGMGPFIDHALPMATYPVIIYATTMLLVWLTTRILMADTGMRMGFADAERLGRPMIMKAMRTLTVVFLTISVIVGILASSVDVTEASGQTVAVSMTEHALSGGESVILTLMIFGSYAPFAFFGATLAGMTPGQSIAHKKIMMKRLKGGGLIVMTPYLGLAMIYLLPLPLMIPASVVFYAWLYVGAREVIGGIGGNGEGRKVAETGKAMAAA